MSSSDNTYGLRVGQSVFPLFLTPENAEVKS